MLTHLFNKKGSTLVAALAVMVVLAAGAATVIHLSGTDTRSYTDDMQASQALAVGNAGLQRALHKLNYGEDPSMTAAFAQGTFAVTTDPVQSKITVVSQVGDAKKTQSINANFARNCVDLIVSSAYIDSATLLDISLTKSCNKYSTLDSTTISWNWSTCACNTTCEGGSLDVDDTNNSSEIVYEDVGDPGRNKFWICHVPPGNPEARQSIAVPLSAWINAHSSGTGQHSLDYLGPCIVSQPDDTDEEAPIVTCEGSDLSASALGACAEDDGNAHITQVTCDTTTIFQSGSIPSASAEPMSSGTTIDLLDYILEDNTTYSIQALFDETIPSGAWFNVVVTFADGSTLSGIVKAGDQPAQLTPTDSASDSLSVSGFEVSNGVTTVAPNYRVQFDVLGSAITCGAGGPEVNVRTKLCIDNICSNLWGYTDVDGGETYSITTGSEASQYKIEANAYLESCNNFSKTYDSTNTIQVKTLRNGEQAPALAGYGGQQSIQQFLSPYLDSTGKVVLAANQVIMLFELGTSGASNSAAADFQDLVILMTVTE